MENKMVTAEDVAAELVPLIREYLLGTCEREGAQIVYTLPDGRQFVIRIM